MGLAVVVGNKANPASLACHGPLGSMMCDPHFTETRPMARLPLIDPSDAAGDAKRVLDSMPNALNIFRMMANAETMIKPAVKLGGAILSKQELGAKERELLILQVANLEGGEYEWNQHDPIAIGVGVPREQIDALTKGDITNQAFNEAEQALLVFSKGVIENVRVKDETFSAAHKHFSDREIVEVIFTIGFYMMMARLTEATQTDIDPPAGMAVVDSLKRDQV